MYGKIGKAAGVQNALNTASSSTQPSLVDPVDGVVKEPQKAPPQKQVWVPKPNELRNPLDTLPTAAAQVAQKKRAAPPSPQAKPPPPKRGEVPLRVLSQRWSLGGVLLQEEASCEA